MACPPDLTRSVRALSADALLPLSPSKTGLEPIHQYNATGKLHVESISRLDLNIRVGAPVSARELIFRVFETDARLHHRIRG